MAALEELTRKKGNGDADVLLKKGHGEGPPPVVVDRDFDPGGDGRNGHQGGPLSNAYLAMILFIGADVMFFVGLIGAFLVFRFGAESWPPAGQPRLPIGVTGLNTALLLASGYTMLRTWRQLPDWQREKILHGLAITALLGIAFLVGQGREWVRLLQFGLTLSAGVYGATFYTLIGCHALHVLGAVIWLSIVWLRMRLRPAAYGPQRHTGIKLVAMYWFLVVALWPVLYLLVYFN